VATPPGGAFAIPSTEGFLRSRDLLGKQVFLFFGFSTCPDICPLTLNTMRQVASALPRTEREHFRFLFISVDPDRDSLSRLKALKREYGPQFIGATDSEASLRKITSQFGAFFQVFKTKSGKTVISHTDSIFHINKEGKWIETLPYGTSADVLIQKVREKENKTPLEGGLVRKAELVAENKACDLSMKSCSISFEKDTFELLLTPRPIRTDHIFTIVFRTLSSTLIPKEVDFEGLKINMGYLRPTLKMKSPGEYQASLSLPICELAQMHWKVRVFLEDPKGELKALQYHLTSTD